MISLPIPFLVFRVETKLGILSALDQPFIMRTAVGITATPTTIGKMNKVTGIESFAGSAYAFSSAAIIRL